jgi:hypothetical protein
MTPGDYFAACRPIHEELAVIAVQTRQMALAGSANAANSRFVQAMDRQEHLIERLKELDAKVSI